MVRQDAQKKRKKNAVDRRCLYVENRKFKVKTSVKHAFNACAAVAKSVQRELIYANRQSNNACILRAHATKSVRFVRTSKDCVCFLSPVYTRGFQTKDAWLYFCLEKIKICVFGRNMFCGSCS